MHKVLAISGSLRSGSFNTRLARLMADVCPEDMRVEVATLHDIPLYDGDVEESDGIPAAVTALRQRITESDALILVTPEYNAGIPGVFKNAIDWLTRPPKEIGPTFGGRPLALAGATPGGGGTILSQAAWLTVLRQLKVRLFPDHLRVSSAGDVLGDSPDEKQAARVRKWLEGLGEFVAVH